MDQFCRHTRQGQRGTADSCLSALWEGKKSMTALVDGNKMILFFSSAFPTWGRGEHGRADTLQVLSIDGSTLQDPCFCFKHYVWLALSCGETWVHLSVLCPDCWRQHALKTLILASIQRIQSKQIDWKLMLFYERQNQTTRTGCRFAVHLCEHIFICVGKLIAIGGKNGSGRANSSIQ